MTDFSWEPAKLLSQLAESRASAANVSQSAIAGFVDHSEAQLRNLLTGIEEPAVRDRLSLAIVAVVLAEADVLRSRERFDTALFRFGHHLRESAWRPGLRGNVKRALIDAALVCFGSLESPPAQVMDGLNRALRSQSSVKADWEAGLGLGREQFVAVLNSALLESHSVASSEIDVSVVDLPDWLRPGTLEDGNPAARWTRNWPETECAGDAQELWTSLGAAWDSSRQGRTLETSAHLEALRACLGTLWLPRRDLQGIRLWNWIRSVTFASTLETDGGSVSLRLVASLLEVTRGLEAESPVPQRSLVVRFQRLLSLNDPESAGVAAAVSARIAAAMGHDAVVSELSNDDRARLRSAWRAGFQKCGLERDDSTQTMVTKLRDEFEIVRALGRQFVEADAAELSPMLRQLAARSMPFLDTYERSLVEQIVDRAGGVAASLTGPPAFGSLQETEAGRRDLAGLRESLARSESALLLDLIGPCLWRLDREARARIREIEGVAEPQLEIELFTSRIPGGHGGDSEALLEFAIRNSGEVDARAIDVTVGSDAIVEPVSMAIGDLSPGEEWVGRMTCVVSSEEFFFTLGFELRFGDDVGRAHELRRSERLEAERLSRWTEHDQNPYQLKSIRDPGRFVGREADLRALDAIVAAQGSTFVTGHKRVGKTSLVNVMLSELADRGLATRIVPLGYAMGGSGGAADIVESILDAIRIAALAVIPEADVPEPDSGQIRSNFGRAAGRWLTDLETKLGDSFRAVVAIDDFDELDPKLISGDQADAFFLFLRSLVDLPWLSLVLVGSEVLPTIIEGQAHKLNQVTQTKVAHFKSPADTSALLIGPTSGVMDWDERALARVHSVSAGSPYYATLLAQMIWNHMRQQDRTYVQLGDVDDVVEELATRADRVHFIHYWADDPAGMDPMSDRAQVNSAVLRAIAEATPFRGYRARVEDVLELASSWIPGDQTERFRSVLNRLVDREVVDRLDGGNAVAIRVPLFGMWLRKTGARLLDDIYRESSVAQPNPYVVSPGVVVGLADGLFYCGEHVSELRIQAWLEQFDEGQERWLAARLLERMASDGYYSSERVARDLFPALVTGIRSSRAGALQQLTPGATSYVENFFVFDREVAGASNDLAVRAVANGLRVRKKTNVLGLSRVDEPVRRGLGTWVLVVPDSFAGTGQQITDQLNAIESTLNESAPGWEESGLLCLAVGLARDRELLDELKSATVEVVVGSTVPDELSAFAPGTGVFREPTDAEAALELVTRIGAELEPEMPIGWGDQGLLLCFEDNCPNNTLPIFWSSGTVGGQPWRPLFERRR